jgi:DNA-binding response OmpR family regulator
MEVGQGSRPTRALGAKGSELEMTMYRRILVVDDEEALRHLIRRNLEVRGNEVREAATAEEAIEAISSDRPDLLLLDLNLPDRSGWDVLRVLRERGIELPTVVISAVRVVPARLAEFRPMGYLPKPFPLEALLRLVAEGATSEPSLSF